MLDATLAFAAFCAISSAGYLFNDLRDAVHDRQHPEKRLRPIASGELAASAAAGPAAVALAAIGVGVALIGVSRRGRRPGGALRGDHRRLLAGPQAARDPRRDDDRLAVPPPRGGRRGRGRGATPRSGCSSARRCSPSSSASRSAARRRCRSSPCPPPPRRSGTRDRRSRRGAGRGDPTGARALFARLPRPDGGDGDRGGDHELRDLRRQQPPDRQPRCSPPRPRSSTGSSATCT